MELAELSLLLIDCQTTGATPARGSVLEIGWGLATPAHPEPRALEAHWVALPEGQRVAPAVRRLLGYDDTASASALGPEAVWRRLRSAHAPLGARVPVAIHFAKFELAFLRDWCARFEPSAPFPFDAVCLHAIACRLFPDLPRRSLRALAGFLGHGVARANRVEPHVIATAHIWHELVPRLLRLGVRTWAELEAWLAEPAPKREGRRRSYPLPRARYAALPDAAGVYRLLRSNGDVLYVGKAASLKRRVASHFKSSFSRSERALEMLSQVNDLDVTLTATALEAALLENEEIKALSPPYNVQLVVAEPRAWYLDRHFEQAASAPDGVHRLGPLPSTFSVRALGALERALVGEPWSAVLAARAMGSPPAFAPDRRTFEAGLAAFVDRHAPERGDRWRVRRSLRRLATVLSPSVRDDEAENSAELDALGPAALEADGTGAWDPERVVRHLERAVAHGHRLLWRARWLRLIEDGVVIYREPASERWRALVLGAGQVLEARDADVGGPRPEPNGRPTHGRAFDRARYDRLRTLTSELKRVLRDGGAAVVGVAPRRWLEGEGLARLLRLV